MQISIFSFKATTLNFMILKLVVTHKYIVYKIIEFDI